ncbi:unnamed protein product [Bemisia tabaci]|uniref:Uncharacterized protein n=1 Tax=Bemisia tabaci TaxID=7038 RepID=A0A9P0AHA6_BEMTA|nr:unnamed protein product [Bemisia tabaci]
MSVRLPLLFCVLCVLCIFPTLINANEAEIYERVKKELQEYYQNDPCQLEHHGWEKCRDAMNRFNDIPKAKRGHCNHVVGFTCCEKDGNKFCQFRIAVGWEEEKKLLTWCLEGAGISREKMEEKAEKGGGKRSWSSKRNWKAPWKMITSTKKGHTKNAPRHEDC